MKKWLIPVIILAVIAFGLYQWAVGFNNKAVELEADAKTAWSNVESSYQRRNDLIGNLVKTVQGAADFERTTLREVIEARAKATSTTIDANNITPEQLAQFQQAQTGLSGAAVPTGRHRKPNQCGPRPLQRKSEPLRYSHHKIPRQIVGKSFRFW